jgi:hypothetical protein
MKLTERDIEIFKILGSSALGKEIVDYLDRMTDYICDARTWGTNDTRESVTKAADMVRRYFRDKITHQNKNQEQFINENE